MIGSRSSDTIAIALRPRPIVRERVMDSAGIVEPQLSLEAAPREDGLDVFRDCVDSLDLDDLEANE